MPLPDVTSPATLDGTTQGCASPPCIALNGNGSTGAHGLSLTGGGTTVRGFVIQYFDEAGVYVNSDGNVVEGNYLGTSITGAGAAPNQYGVRVWEASDNTVGGTVAAARNVLSGNTNAGIQTAYSTNNTVLGNVIGLNAAASNGVPNIVGVEFNQSSGNTAGGTVPGARNIISANAFGLAFFNQAPSNLAQGNYIGTDPTGTVAIPNTSNGLHIQAASDCTVGGTSVGAGNLISGNLGDGIYLHGDPGYGGTTIQGNIIGTDVTGEIGIPNAGYGIYLDRTPDNIVGGGLAAARNLISANALGGMLINGAGSTNNTVSGNYVGVNIDGSFGLGNASHGMLLNSGAADNIIGGTGEDAGNLVSGNAAYGIAVSASNGNQILGNTVGTDLHGDYAIPNNATGIGTANSSHVTIGGTEPGARNLVSGNGEIGIYIYAVPPLVSHDSVVQGNHVGTDRDGESAIPNGMSGVKLKDARQNLIGGTIPGARNVVSGNTSTGILIDEVEAYENQVLGNYIGIRASGTGVLGNAHGVGITDGAGSNVIGGDVPGAGNVISGNGYYGVSLNESHSNTVAGNVIGLDPSGTVAWGNGSSGVNVQGSQQTIIGGTTPGSRNLISGNGSKGVVVWEVSILSVVQGNYIGTDVSGTVALGNALAGVKAINTSAIKIGGTEPGAGNLISGNDEAGVLITQPVSGGTDIEVLGNLIGTDAGGTQAIGNLVGVMIDDASQNTIEGNVIASNDEEGIEVLSGTGNTILGNSIRDNGKLGIDLAGDGVTPNDTMDPDLGPNRLQNYPDLDTASATATGVTIDGVLNSRRNSTFRVEFFASESCDGSGHGEGARFLGFADVTTAADGNGAFSPTFPAPVSDGDAITATATFTGDTSEFSNCVTAACSGLVTFAPTLLAQDANSLIWAGTADVRYCSGDLGDVGAYVTTDDGMLFGATGMDISGDNPASGSGLYYVVRPLGCGSWQTLPGAEPDRDADLP